MKNRFWNNHHGVITVFVVLIMVPVVVITGVMVDVARARLFASQVAMASDSYGDVILSQYDNVLKELYGLFSVTQNESGKEALEKYADYVGYSFDPDEDRTELSGSMFYDSADVDFSYENIEVSSLTNENVFITQIADYMEFRVIQQVINENGTFDGGVFDMLDQFSTMEPDNEAVDAVSKLGNESGKLVDKIDKYHSIMVEIKKYENYLDTMKKNIDAYSKKLADICNSDEYKRYVNYLENKEEIDDAKKREEWINSDENTDGETLTDEEKNLIEQYVDVGSYRKEIRDAIEPIEEKAKEEKEPPHDFEHIEGKIDDLEKAGCEVEIEIANVESQLNEVEDKLNNGCSEDVKAGIEKDIEDMKKISEMKGKFLELSELENSNHNKQNNKDNKANRDSVISELDSAKNAMLSDTPPKSADWNQNIVFVWWRIPDEKGSFYADVDNMYNEVDSEEEAAAKKKAAEKKQDNADAKTKETVEQLNKEEEDTKARDIPDSIMIELKSTPSGGSIPSFKDYFEDGFTFKAVGKNLTKIYDKFLLTEYDFGMFSSRVSGIAKTSDDESKEEKKEEYVDYSLNKVPMNRNINYLYGAEIEYLYGGHQKSKDNLASARNVICGVRATMNYISTYAIKEVNSTINTIALEASAAVSATGVGALVAPAVKIAVSAALRMAVAAVETKYDWDNLKNREDVLLFKSKLEELECVEDLKDILSPELESGEGIATKRNGVPMSYEDYLHVLLFLCVDDSDLVNRTSDLITLNVNQSQNSSDDLTSLTFKMSNTVTAVKTTCKAQLDMVVVPDNFLSLFLSGNETQQNIEGYDDKYVYYTMIRGY